MSLLCGRTGSYVQVVVIIPVVTQRLVPMVLLTMEIPQLQFIDNVIQVQQVPQVQSVRRQL